MQRDQMATDKPEPIPTGKGILVENEHKLLWAASRSKGLKNRVLPSPARYPERKKSSTKMYTTCRV